MAYKKFCDLDGCNKELTNTPCHELHIPRERFDYEMYHFCSMIHLIEFIHQIYKEEE